MGFVCDFDGAGFSLGLLLHAVKFAENGDEFPQDREIEKECTGKDQG